MPISARRSSANINLVFLWAEWEEICAFFSAFCSAFRPVRTHGFSEPTERFRVILDFMWVLWASQYKTLYLPEYYPIVPYRNHTYLRAVACLCLFDPNELLGFTSPHHPRCYRPLHTHNRAKERKAPAPKPSEPAPPPTEHMQLMRAYLGTRLLFLRSRRTTPTMHAQSTRRTRGTQTVHQHIHRVAGAVRHEALDRLNAGADQNPEYSTCGRAFGFSSRAKKTTGMNMMTFESCSMLE